MTWSFAESSGSRFNFSDYITEPVYRELIRDAFQAWENVIDIDFVEVTDSGQSNIRLGWDQIDGDFGVVGEAASRGSKTTSTLFSMTEAEIRFDIAENWADSKDVARNEVGLFQVALHEIGHVLGLSHTTSADTIMYSSDISDLDGLAEGDIAGAQIFYGVSPNFVSTPEPEPEPEPVAPAPYTPTVGNDTFTARSGDDVIDGGAGIDTLALSGVQTEYTLTLSPDGMVLTDRLGRDGSDSLINIEQLAFQGGSGATSLSTFNLDAFDGITQLGDDAFAEIVELYIAYFNRAPDAVGLAFWGNAFADGLSMEEMAALFIDQNETRSLYPNGMSDSDFALAVYNNVLGRVPDADGFTFWVNALSSGAVGRDTFILAVLEGAKADFPAGASADFVAQVQADRDYLSNKADIGVYFAVEHGMSNTANASSVMQLFDGTLSSMQDAYQAVDVLFANASDPGSGEFLMPLVGVLDLPMQ